MTNSSSKKKRGKGRESLIRVIDSRPKRLFAIGDIHGCIAELAVLLDHLANRENLAADDQIIFIGDYIDRGPASRDVVEALIQLKLSHPSTVFLKGNHEDMLLSFLGLGGHAGQAYLSNGGFEFFRSYGVAPLGPLEVVRNGLPESHRQFFDTLEIGVQLAEFVFVHAGIHPGKPLPMQTTHDLMWIRNDFTMQIHPLPQTVVFGHTPFEDVLIHLPYKIGIDTGLVYGNKLSCVELVEGMLYQVGFDERDVKVASLRDRISSTT